MNNQSFKKKQMPHIVNWQIAYAARELRHNKTVTLSCLKSETDLVLRQLSSFSYSSPIKMNTAQKQNSNEVLLEIVETT